MVGSKTLFRVIFCREKKSIAFCIEVALFCIDLVECFKTFSDDPPILMVGMSIGKGIVGFMGPHAVAVVGQTTDRAHQLMHASKPWHILIDSETAEYYENQIYFKIERNDNSTLSVSVIYLVNSSIMGLELYMIVILKWLIYT
jgi:hypothetical protein